jgi:hypothetical protein
MTAKSALQLAAFLGDVLFVGCLGAMVLYGLWLSTRSKGLAGLGRLSLVVAFGAGLTMAAIGQGYVAGMSLPLMYLFLLVAVYILLEFLFQMSVLGLWVSAIATGVASLRYLPLPPLPAVIPANAAVAYWWTLRDLAYTAGAAAMTLAIGAVVLLNVWRDARPSELVHPNDLRDVARLVARGTVPCFFFAVFASGMATSRNPHPTLLDGYQIICLLALFGGGLALWYYAANRRFTQRAMVLTVILNVLALAAYAASGLLPLGLTPGGPIP